MKKVKNRVNVSLNAYIDFERKRICHVDGKFQEIQITRNEVNILEYLCLQSDNENNGWVTSEQIFTHLNGSSYERDGSKPNVTPITKAMSKLRAKHSDDFDFYVSMIILAPGNGNFKLSLVESPYEENQAASSACSPSKLTSQGVFLFEKGNLKEAVVLFQQSAIMDDPEGQYWLGYCYRFGKGIQSNHFQAVKWFQKAADQGCPNAQHFLGICYYRGQGIEKNYTKAFELQSLAASQGHADAQYDVAWAYYYGKGTEKNIELAIESMKKAVEMGHLCAANGLRIIQKSDKPMRRVSVIVPNSKYVITSALNTNMFLGSINTIEPIDTSNEKDGFTNRELLCTHLRSNELNINSIMFEFEAVETKKATAASSYYRLKLNGKYLMIYGILSLSRIGFTENKNADGTVWKIDFSNSSNDPYVTISPAGGFAHNAFALDIPNGNMNCDRLLLWVFVKNGGLSQRFYLNMLEEDDEEGL